MIIGVPVPNNYFQPWESTRCFLSVANFYKIISVQGPYIYENRNLMFEKAKKINESILMIDSDMVFTLEDVQKIEKHLERLDIITGLYPMGVSPHPPCIFKKIPGDYQLVSKPKVLSEVDACGGGFLGISSKVIQQLPGNPFNNVWEGKIKHGEDISFCYRAKEKGFKIWCDPEIKVAQIRTNLYYVV